MIEDRIVDMLLNQNHFFLVIGIFCFLYVVRAMDPVATFLFSKKWRWLIPLVNLGISAVGVFLLGMTSATTVGMKLVVVLLITAVTSYGYELTKPLVKKILKKLLGEDVANNFFAATKEIPESSEKTPS